MLECPSRSSQNTARWWRSHAGGRGNGSSGADASPRSAGTSVSYSRAAAWFPLRQHKQNPHIPYHSNSRIAGPIVLGRLKLEEYCRPRRICLGHGRSQASSVSKLSGSPRILRHVTSSSGVRSFSRTMGNVPLVRIFQYSVSVSRQPPQVRGPSSPKSPI